ncbi:hypothetical protein RRG08_006776 [Elysia crispata]|uniref:Uncharacterized protein n=1 Tax=Elysia crispata TaxID=231223 RepID=A0AAE0YBJ9_9GAST|nr:hypothetical protein RRG08_006776 [Elysia crispata]
MNFAVIAGTPSNSIHSGKWETVHGTSPYTDAQNDPFQGRYPIDALILLSNLKHTGTLPLAGEVAILWRGLQIITESYCFENGDAPSVRSSGTRVGPQFPTH